ncbi:hypothetical protein NEOC95_000893, partial [Neochlamydia sp. AcF95]|nr:hypothetical protein [Neochlamydia sp. AcF95]
KFTFFLFKIDAMMEFFRVNQVGLFIIAFFRRV